MNPFPNPNVPPFPDQILFPYPDRKEYFEPVFDISSLAFELALLTLNMTRGEFNSMTEVELKRFIGNECNDSKERLALKILLNSKKNNPRFEPLLCRDFVPSSNDFVPSFDFVQSSNDFVP